MVQNKEILIKRLLKLHATCFGLYMAQRVIGNDAEVQLKRLRQIQEKIKEVQNQ